MLGELKRALGGWVRWRDCAPGANDPSHVLVYANELRAIGHRIERRGQNEAEEYRLVEP